MGLMCLLAVYLLQCRSSLCLHPENGLLLWCFYKASLWLRRFLSVVRWREFALSFLCEWSQKPWLSRQIILLPVGFWWPYSCCFVGCCCQDLFNIVCSIIAQLPSSFFSIHLVSVHVLHPYSSMHTYSFTTHIYIYIYIHDLWVDNS